VLGFNASNLSLTPAFNDTPNGGSPTGFDGAGIWQSGLGPAADADGNIYVGTGNGLSDAITGKGDYGDSYLKLSPTLQLTDWFMPYNVQTLDNNDLDISSSGAVLIPNLNYFFGGGKEGKLYLLNRSNLSHFTADATAQAQVVQSVQVTPNSDGIIRNIHGGPVFWQGPTAAYAYVWGEQDSFKAYRFDYTTDRFDTTPASQSTMLDPTGCGGVCMPGAALSLSSNGSAPGSGIIWTSLPLTGDAAHYVRPGVLRAFDATDLSHELWDSEQNPTDHVDAFAKFSAPTIANGHVYLATFSGYLAVYGLRDPNAYASTTNTSTSASGACPSGGTCSTTNTSTSASGACPSGGTCADIGSPGVAGGQNLSNGAWTIQGAGGDIWNGADQFHYVWQSLTGDGNLSARVTAQANTDVWAKAGLMLRQSADPGAPFYDVLLTPGNGVNVQYRATAGANAVQVTGTPATPPVYVRVARAGNAFTAYTSADGVTWTAVPNSTVTLALPSSLLAGLAITSHNAATLGAATLGTVRACPQTPQLPGLVFDPTGTTSVVAGVAGGRARHPRAVAHPQERRGGGCGASGDRWWTQDRVWMAPTDPGIDQNVRGTGGRFVDTL